MRATRFVGVILFAAACGQPAEVLTPANQLESTAAVRDLIQGEFAPNPRIDLVVSATGEFRPADPISVSVSAVGRHTATSLQITVDVIGDSTPYVGSGARRLGTISGSLQRSQAMHRTGIVHRFRNPGYYWITANARATGPESVDGDRSPIQDEVSEGLWILISENEGRVTSSFDPTIVNTGTSQPRYLRFGSYGEFITGPPTTPNQGATGPAGSHIAVSMVSPAARGTRFVPTGTVTPVGPASMQVGYSGRLTYVEPGSQVTDLRPIPNHPISSRCVWPIAYYPQVYTDANGYFTFNVSCQYGLLVNAGPALAGNGYTSVTGWNGAAAVLEGYIAGPGYVMDYRVGNSFAGAAYTRINLAASRAVQRYGRSRPVVTVWAGEQGDTLKTYYSTQFDRIQINALRAIDQDGIFVAAHEYGHAYQYVASEPWNSYFCSDTGHVEYVAYTRSCAYVEGFADFFAMWLLGDLLVARDGELEQGVNWGGGVQGLHVEGAFAAFLLDLVDTANDPDGLPGDDDTMSYPASWIEQNMRACGGSSFTRLDGPDQFIYCVERVLNDARSYAPLPYRADWRIFSGFASFPGAPQGYDQQRIRAGWLWNLYRIGALQ